MMPMVIEVGDATVKLTPRMVRALLSLDFADGCLTFLELTQAATVDGLVIDRLRSQGLVSGVHVERVGGAHVVVDNFRLWPEAYRRTTVCLTTLGRTMTRSVPISIVSAIGQRGTRRAWDLQHIMSVTSADLSEVFRAVGLGLAEVRLGSMAVDQEYAARAMRHRSLRATAEDIAKLTDAERAVYRKPLTVVLTGSGMLCLKAWTSSAVG